MTEQVTATATSSDPSTPPDQPRPNILWILGEDVSPDFGVYGNPDVFTPNIDRLAAEGRLYRNAFSTAPVCSPSRSALITGCYQTSIGAHNHRSHRHDGYQLPDGVLLLPERLRQVGYYSAGVVRFPDEVGLRVSPKQDWNFEPPDYVWDSDSWVSLKDHQPFFGMINMAETHRPYGGGTGPAVDPAQITSMPPYVADHPLARADWAAYLETVQTLDANVGKILSLLDEDGLRENTVVMFLADHGREDFRGKSSAFDAGTRVPLIVRWPGHIAPGTTSDQLVSLIDLTAATVALAGAVPTADETPFLQGVDFLSETAPVREYVFTARDRIEASVDRVRTVFDGRYRYIRNFLPDQPHLIEREYYDRTNPVRNLMRQLHAEGQLTPEQARVFAPQRPSEELYDLLADPFELHDLATSTDPDAVAALPRLRAALDVWIVETQDQGGIPEEPEAIDIGGGPGRRKKSGGGQSRATSDSARRRNVSETAPSQSGDAPIIDEPLVLAQCANFFVGGRSVSAPAGGRGGGQAQTTVIEQSPVHTLIPFARTQTEPVVMVPGHGLTSYIYLATPDGREGWAQIFARRGYGVFVVDQPNYAVSGLDLRPFEDVRSGRTSPDMLPKLMRWTNESAWQTWGFGPEPGTAFEDAAYPVSHVDQLYASLTTVVSGGGSNQGQGKSGKGRRAQGGAAESSRGSSGGRFGADLTAANLIELLLQVGSSILVVHSAAAAASVEVLQMRPELVTTVVMVEPAGSPTEPEKVETLFESCDYLAVFGDHFETRGMQGRYESCLATAELVRSLGRRGDVVRLPDRGIVGNSHLLMQDRNNAAVAQIVMDWLVNDG